MSKPFTLADLFGPGPDRQEDDGDPTADVTCKYCGKTRLYWEEFDGWKLFDSRDDERHFCRTSAVDEFSDL